MYVDKLKSDIPDEIIDSLARCILPSIGAYFESEEGQKEYAEWLEKRRNDQAAVVVNVISDSQPALPQPLLKTAKKVPAP